MGSVVAVQFLSFFPLCQRQCRYHIHQLLSPIGRLLTMLRFRITGAVGEVWMDDQLARYLLETRLTAAQNG